MSPRGGDRSPTNPQAQCAKIPKNSKLTAPATPKRHQLLLQSRKRLRSRRSGLEPQRKRRARLRPLRLQGKKPRLARRRGKAKPTSLRRLRSALGPTSLRSDARRCLCKVIRPRIGWTRDSNYSTKLRRPARPAKGLQNQLRGLTEELNDGLPIAGLRTARFHSADAFPHLLQETVNRERLSDEPLHVRLFQ